MNQSDYDTVEGIDLAITNLASLHAFRTERHKAYYERKEDLHDFILLGRFWLDTCGNFMSASFKHYDGHTADNLVWMPDALPRVVPYEAIAKLFQGLQITGSMDTWLPKTTDTCDECDDAWTIETCHDAITLGYDDKRHYRHEYCHSVALMRKGFQEFIDILAIAGIATCPLIPIKNEYWGDEKTVPPWFLIRTVRGDIKIGWRKSVINIDWSDIVVRKIAALKWTPDLSHYKKKEEIAKLYGADAMFPEVKDTKGDYYIHAYGGEPAASYLERLAITFRIGAHT